MMSNVDMMPAFFAEHPLRTFAPIAYYDKHLDCIRVEIRDCSVTETRVNDVFTIFEDNYPENGQREYVGFTIKGVSYVFKKVGLPLDGVHKITDIIHKIVVAYPSEVMGIAGVALGRLENMLNETELQVDFAEAA